MMLGLNGRPSDLDVFAYYLAHELHMSIGEVEAMPSSEYENWRAYFTARNACENLTPQAAI